MTIDEQDELYERAQDLARTATVYDGLLYELSSSERDRLCEEVGREVYELVRRRIDEKRVELEAQAVSEEVSAQ